MMKALLARLRSGDRGVTLIEMMVVVGIFGTVMAIVAQGLMLAQSTLNENSTRLDGLSQTNLTMEAMTRVLRTAILPSQVQATCTGCDTAAFIAGDDNKVVFYANVDNDGILPATGTTDYGPRKVTYELKDGELQEMIQKPNVHAVTDFNYQYCANPGTSGCPATKRVLARDVTTTDSATGLDDPVFTYYDRDGGVLATPLQAGSLRAVDSIDVVLRVQPSDRTKPVTVVARVTLPNADSLIQPTPTP
jgi:prepilin-type N-terminal cleavage/methylation domain-containing protein